MSEPDFISERLDLAKNCDIESTEEACQMFLFDNRHKRYLNSTEIEWIRFVFIQKPYLRELYDKSEIFIRKNLEKTFHNPSEGTRYLSAFKDLGSFTMFMIIMVFFIEKHQNFAK